MEPASHRPRPPWPLGLACLMLLLEAAALAAMAIALVADMVRGSVAAAGATVVMAVFFLGLAGLLVLCARALATGKRWGRGPAVTWQLLQTASALATAAAGPVLLTVAMVGSAVVALAGILVPASREHLAEPGVPPGLS